MIQRRTFEGVVSEHSWDIPMYSPALAGRLVGLRPERVRRWLFGYDYTYPVDGAQHPRHGHKDPVVVRGMEPEARYASFLDLIDLLFVRTFLEHGVTLQRLRRALDEARVVTGGHHFAQRCFFTDGREIYLQIKNLDHALLHLMSGGQWAIAPIIKETAKRIEFDSSTGFARRWYPLGRKGLVVLDPDISFGAPTVVKRGVETAVVYDLFIAEGERVEPVSSWLNLREREISSAVGFERQLRAA